MKTARVNANAVMGNATALAIANAIAEKQQSLEVETQLLFCRQLREIKEYYDSIKQLGNKEELMLTMLTELEGEMDFEVDGEMTDECIVALYLTRKCTNLTEAFVNAAVATLHDDVTAVAVTH